MNKFFLMVCFYSLSNVIWAQDNISVDIYGNRNQLLDVSPRIPDEVLTVNYGMGISLLVPAYSRNRDEESFHYPNTGISFCYTDLNHRSLGSMYQLMLDFEGYPFQPNHRAKKIAISTSVSGGGTIVSKKYDSKSNIENVMISTNLSVGLKMSLKLHVQLMENWELFLAYMMNHASNGRWKKPNIGINNLGAEVGVRYKLPYTSSLFYRFSEEKNEKLISEQKYFVDVTASTGLAVESIDGKQYPIFNTNVSLVKKAGKSFFLNTGLDFSVDWSLNENKKIHNPDNTEPISRLGYFVGVQPRFGRFGFAFQIGVYLYEPYDVTETDLFQRYQLMYNLRKNIYLKVALKAHLGIADYTEWGIGYRF